MVNQNWWITTLMIREHKYCPPLTQDIKCDVLFLGLGKGGREAVQSELECRQSVGFTDQRTYNDGQLTAILGAQGYTVAYAETEKEF
jgi:hypothetical protein